MKRRDLLKGIIGAGIVISAPSLAKEPAKWWESYAHESVPLHKGVIDMPAPESDKTFISIEGWINSPIAQELEQIHKRTGSLPKQSSWNDFKIVNSIKAHENYDSKGNLIDGDVEPLPPNHHYIDGPPSTIIHTTYSLFSYADNADERLMRFLSTTLFSLRIRALSTKVEGAAIGQGKLILQSRMNIVIEDDEDHEGARRIMWRGAMERINVS